MAFRSNLRRDEKSAIRSRHDEMNMELRVEVIKRLGWSWVRNHGGYAQYYAGPGRIAIVHVDAQTSTYDAERIRNPHNDGIRYGAATPAEIIAAVEGYDFSQ